MPTSLQGYESVFVSDAAAKVAKLERIANQHKASISFLEAQQRREEAVRNADWGVSTGRISVNQRQAVIEMGATNPTRQAEFIARQPSARTRSGLTPKDKANLRAMGGSEAIKAIHARKADDEPRSLFEPRSPADVPGEADKSDELAEQNADAAIKHLQAAGKADLEGKIALLQAAKDAVSNALVLRTKRQPTQASPMSASSGGWNRGIGTPRFETYVGG
jgi:hypothetical protein